MSKLKDDIQKKTSFDSLEQEAMLTIQRAADELMRDAERLFKPYGLSPTAFNVLRILRGEGMPLSCGEIASRMITRDPDLTRLLDRLESRGLITRARAPDDRRVVRAEVTPAALELLRQLDEPILRMHHEQLSHLGNAKLRTLIDLLDEARAHKGR